MGKLALPPGFRFHPTDEELVSYYLKRKNYGRKIDFDAIGDLDLYKFEPCDLPELARLQTKDLEWYFFCPRDKKYPNGSRTNRATENGYWKATGKDRAVSSRSISVGMKKTLVYYKGRAPKGERTNWVMHEYRLEDCECERGEAFQNCFVLCRIYQKSGAGPKNGEQYGAPVEEEEWETVPAAETGDISGFGAILQAYQGQDTHHSVDVSGEQLSKETKQISSNGSANGHVVLKAEPEDVKVFEREEMQYTNLPVQMIAELYGRSVINEDVMGYANTSDEEPEHSANVVAMFLSPPDDGEEEILEEIQDLVATSTQSDCNVGPSSGAYLEAHVGFDERDAHLPTDGDFFELNDLSPICDSDGMVEQTNARKEIWETNGNTSSLQSVLEDVQPRAPLTSWSFGSCGQAGIESSLDKLKPYSGLYGAVSERCSTGGEELEHNNIPDFFKNYNTAGAGERESYNAEFDGGRLLAGHVQSEGLVVCPAGLDDQDEQYLDAFLSFSDMVDMNLLNTGLSSLDTIDDSALSGKPWIEKKGELGQVHLDNGTTAGASSIIDMSSRNSSASAQTVQNYDGTLVCNKRSEAANASDGRGTSSKAFGVILHCLESLPILPASAADMSSRSGTPLGSISVVASSVDIRAVAVNCSCINKDGVASSCMTCSFENKGTFVRSLSYTGRRMVVKDSSTGFLALGIMGAIWAFFWFLIVGGSWKLLGGAFRLIFS